LAPDLPTTLHLEFVIPLFLVGEVVPKFANPAASRAIFTAATVVLLALSAPLHLGIALAIVAGIAAGLTARPDVSAQSTHPLQRTTEVRR
jgi:predicted branched-subunit amino acid permease